MIRNRDRYPDLTIEGVHYFAGTQRKNKGLHQQKVFEHCDLYGEELPVTTSICKRTLAIPVSPYLKEEDQDKIIRLIREKTGANA